MNCLSEYVYSVYVDGELEPSEARNVEAHLVQCQKCRRSILALQEEGALLRDVLHQRATEATAQARAPSGARARGLLVGLAPALALTALVVTAGGWVLEQRLPRGIGWMNPLSFFGAYEMFFDFVFMARDRAPAVFDLGIAVGATAGIAGLLTFIGSAVLRRAAGVGALSVLAALLVFGAPAESGAVELRWNEQQVTVHKSETVEETLVVSAESFVIDGVVDGDVVALTERLDLRGTVRGNVLVGAREVIVTGHVEGALHVICEICTIEGRVDRNFYGAGERVHVRDDAEIGRDTFLFGEHVQFDGRTERDFFAAAGSAEIHGEIGRNAATRTERVSVFEDASIGGDLDVQTPSEGSAEIASGARISGETLQSKLEHPMPQPSDRFSEPGFYMRVVVFIASAFLVGMVLHTLFPRLFAGRLETSGDFARCLGFGFVALVATPIFLVICFITVIGIPIGIIGVFVYLTTLFVSLIVTGALVGAAITRTEPEGTHGFGAALLLGLVILAVAMNIPFIGGLVRLLVGLTGMGLLILGGIETWRRSRAEYA